MNEQITKTLAEAYNLLCQSDVSGLKGAQLTTAGQIMEGFHNIVQELAAGKIQIVAVEGDADETQ